MLPIIVLLSVILMSIILTFVALGHDLLDKGCVAWHRDSIGYLIQALVAYICILVTACNVRSYIAAEEFDDNEASSKSCSRQQFLVSKVNRRVVVCRAKRNGVFHASPGPLKSVAAQDNLLPRQELHHAPGYIDLSRIDGLRLRKPL